VARLNGCDFALIAPDVERPSALASELSSSLTPLENMHGEGLMKRLPIGVVGYAGGEPRERLLSRLDSALASAEYARRGAAHIGDPETVMPARTDLAGWREALEYALDTGKVRIDAFPVLDRRGALLHYEAPSRILIDDLWYCAEAFLAWAERLGLTARIDLAALQLALERIEAEGRPVGINVSASSLCDAGFLDAFRGALEAHATAAASLWIELPEQGVVADLAAFRALCGVARPFGCRLGIEHAGREFGQLGGLHDVGLDYVKIDAGLVRNIATNQDKQSFLARICELARAIGLLVIAEGVDHLDDLEAVRTLDFDGMTGSAVRLQGGQRDA
jgi:EAL domain-containing protein (putative c-di-GMP-specific phosphodiesterase class I)